MHINNSINSVIPQSCKRNKGTVMPCAIKCRPRVLKTEECGQVTMPRASAKWKWQWRRKRLTSGALSLSNANQFTHQRIQAYSPVRIRSPQNAISAHATFKCGFQVLVKVRSSRGCPKREAYSYEYEYIRMCSHSYPYVDASSENVR